MKLIGKIMVAITIPLIILLVFTSLAIRAVGDSTATQLVEHELKTATYALVNRLYVTEPENYQGLLNKFSESTDVDAVLFVDNKSTFSSIMDRSGNPAIGEALDAIVMQKIEESGSYFCEDVRIGGKSFMGYYSTFPNGTIILVAIENDFISSLYARAVNGNLIFMGVLVIISCILVAFVVRLIVKAIEMAVKNIDKVSSGEFNFEVENKLVQRSDEIGNIARNITKLIQNLALTITGIHRNVQNLNDFSDEFGDNFSRMRETISNVNIAVGEIAQGATSQAEETQRVNMQVMEIGNSIDATNQTVEALNDTAREMKRQNDSMNAIMQELLDISHSAKESVNLVHEQTNITNKSAQSISEAVEIITNIADETSLLSLNASIEAARAGEQGRGFAVVADQVRSLAEQSNEAAGKITEIINGLLANSNTSVETMQEVIKEMEKQGLKLEDTQSAFSELNQDILSVGNMVENISNEMIVLNNAKEEVLSSVESLSAISEENAASTEETSASMEELDGIVSACAESTENLEVIADDLTESVRKFKI
ncbi:MAG: methyl-accepting chemotaxis protein [Agathobacter sp.]|nr:methyl-accepting chemotaxis protein [Agathobacter sp.]